MLSKSAGCKTHKYKALFSRQLTMGHRKTLKVKICSYFKGLYLKNLSSNLI